MKNALLSATALALLLVSPALAADDHHHGSGGGAPPAAAHPTGGGGGGHHSGGGGGTGGGHGGGTGGTTHRDRGTGGAGGAPLAPTGGGMTGGTHHNRTHGGTGGSHANGGTGGGGNAGRTHNNAFNSLRRVFNAPRHYHHGSYNRPQGWYAHRWTSGEFLPTLFFAQSYWIGDYEDFDLADPPEGTTWVRYGNDALLIDEDSGEVIQVEYGVFY